MVGYYKNPEATKAAFTEDGWMHTGDLGCVDAQGNVFLRGRSKTMILGPSGQNIYPEEIESLLNAQPEIDESLVVSRNNKLHALLYLTDEHLEQLRSEETELNKALAQAVENVNHRLPAYSHIADFEWMSKEFEKTPKRSIKRYMYK
jgi:long-chain acyl-CoA synthetase